MSLIEAFATYLATTLGLTLGQDLRIGEAPSSNKVPDTLWWVISRGGTVINANTTNENTKEYVFEVYYRNRNYREVHEQMQTLEEEINCTSCVDLQGYNVVNSQSSPLFVDNDLDNEDRKVGLLQVNLTIYKGDC